MCMDDTALQKAIKNAERQMEAASARLDFIEAARFRDEMFDYKKELERRHKGK